MRSSHTAYATDTTCDEANLLLDAGLVPLLVLADRAGLGRLLTRRVTTVPCTHLPSWRYTVNAAWLACAVVTHNVITHDVITQNVITHNLLPAGRDRLTTPPHPTAGGYPRAQWMSRAHRQLTQPAAAPRERDAVTPRAPTGRRRGRRRAGCRR